MKRISYLSVILFVFAAWFMIFFFWAFIESNNYVRSVINAGTATFRGNEFEIVSYYMTNGAPYAFYALTTGVLGWVLMKLKERKIADIRASHAAYFEANNG